LVDERGKKFDLERKSIKDFNDNCKREIKNKEGELVDKKKDEEEKITKEWAKINKIKKEQKADRQRLQKRDMRQTTTRILDIFLPPNTYCEEPKRFDGTDHAGNQNDWGTFRNDIPPEDQSHKIYRAIPEPCPVFSSGMPISQSENSQALISSDEVKTIESSGKPVVQSGYSLCYHSGTEILDKNGKKDVTVSS